MTPHPPVPSPATAAPSAATSPTTGTLRILLIEDDRKFARLVKEYLEPFGFSITAVHSGPEGVQFVHAETASSPAENSALAAVILDLMLPGIDGFEVLRRIREKSNVPVLMLTARGDETDRIVGLEIGADDYLAKTASTRELLARLRAIIRRSARPVPGNAPVTNELVVGPVRVLPDARKVWLNDQPILLTPVEFDLLVVLAKARGRVKTRDQLLDEIRDRQYEVFDRSIDVHVSALRKKLGDDPRKPRLIHTIRTVGYMMDPNRSEPVGGSTGSSTAGGGGGEP
jgi:DNA-binding response OmpR family regulator